MLLPVGGLLILDLGFFGFAAFDAMSDEHKFFLTRPASPFQEGVLPRRNHPTRCPSENPSLSSSGAASGGRRCIIEI
ncbi:hypothetical protein AB3R30_26800 [Leptolyngbyaceae cyanobacterium UHCC 1019]